MKISHQIGYGVIAGWLCAWAVFFSIRQTYAMDTQESKVKLETNCLAEQVIVDISNLNFSIDPSGSPQYAWWERLSWSYSSDYYGNVVFSWVIVEDRNANCDISRSQGNSTENALRYLTMSAGEFSAHDGQVTYRLTPAVQADTSFDYGDNQSNMHFAIKDNPVVQTLSGSLSQQLIQEGDITIMQTGSLTALEKYILKRNIQWGDQRKIILQYTPSIDLTLPSNMPTLPFEGSLYINLYALAHGDNTRLGWEETTQTGAVSTGSQWPMPILTLKQYAQQKASQLDDLNNREHNNFIINMRSLYRQGKITRDIYNNLRKNKYEKYFNKLEQDFEKQKLTENDYRQILSSIIDTIDTLL